MSLFADGQKSLPLAKRMAPQNLDEYQGQAHLVGENKPIRMMIQQRTVQSMIFYGSPATGKTGLAQIIAQSLEADFIAVNALTLNSDDIKKIHTQAQQNYQIQKKTVLFVDEIHRMTRPKQDVFLESIENGLIILIGATTENPFFALQSALRSRILIFEFFPLNDEQKKNILHRALKEDSLLVELNISLKSEAEEFLLQVSSDPRNMLTVLETAVLTKGVVPSPITKSELEIIMQKADTLYDSEQQHYDVISAFIKSVRGSDPDASLYYLSLMVESGEDPRFIFRRLLISAVEDVGLASPDAVSVVHACAESFERVGYPEGVWFMSHATLFLCGLPKSNSVLSVQNAISFIKAGNRLPVPEYLQDNHYPATKNKTYKYPHDYEGNFINQQYLSEEKNFYKPSESGFEKKIKTRLQNLWKNRFF